MIEELRSALWLEEIKDMSPEEEWEVLLACVAVCRSSREKEMSRYAAGRRRVANGDRSVSERVRLRRQERRWSRAELVQAANVSYATLGRIENGHIQLRPRMATIEKLASALEVSVDYLMGGRSGEGE